MTKPIEHKSIRELLENPPYKTITGTATGGNDSKPEDIKRMLRQKRLIIDYDKLLLSLKELMIKQVGEKEYKHTKCGRNFCRGYEEGRNQAIDTMHDNIDRLFKQEEEG